MSCRDRQLEARFDRLHDEGLAYIGARSGSLLEAGAMFGQVEPLPAECCARCRYWRPSSYLPASRDAMCSRWSMRTTAADHCGAREVQP